MTDENITVSGGILLVRSESGRSKLEKVLVETKPGQTKSRVKCRLQRFVNETMAPFLIRNNKKDIISKAVHSSLTNIHRNSLPMDGDGDFEVPRIREKYAKDTEVPNLQMIYSQGSIHVLQRDLRRVEIISSSKKLDSEIALLRTEQMEYKDPHTQETVPSSKKLDSELDEALLRTEQMESKAVSSSKKLDSELDGILPTKEHKEVKEDEDCEKIENNASLPNLFKIDSETNTLYENESKNHESTIHVPYSDDDDDFEADDDEFALEPITTFRKYNQLGEDPAKVKAQYHKPHGGGEHSEPEDEDDDDDEDYDTDDEDEDYDIEVDDHSRFIDSGLRRLKSEESRLFVLPVIYKTKRRPPSYDDDIKPVLGEIPSDVFHEPEDTTKSEEVIIPQSSYEKVPTDVSTDDDVSKTPSEGSDIDTKPLERLKELEDTTFTISTEGLVPEDVPSETRGAGIPGKIPGKVVKDKDVIRVRSKEPSDDVIPGKIPGKVVKDKDDIRVRTKESSDDVIPGKIPGKVVKDKDDIRDRTKESSDDLIPGKIPGKFVKDKVDIRVRTKESSDDFIPGKIPGKVVKSKVDIRVRTKEPSDDSIPGKIPGIIVKDKVDIRVRTKEPSDDSIPGRIPGKVVKDKVDIRVRTKESSGDSIPGRIPGKVVKDKVDIRVRTKEPSDDLIPGKIPGRVVKDKDDIRVHTKEPSDDFSSSDIKPRKKKKKSSIFRFFRKKDDFCVHTAEPSGSDYSTTALDKKLPKDICIHTVDPSGKSDYSSTTVDESNTIENTNSKRKLRIKSNFSSRDVFDQKGKGSTNKLPNRSNVASSTVYVDSGKTLVKLPERGNFASETVFNKKRDETSLQLARRNNPYSATHFNDSIQKSETSKRKLSGRSYFASTSMFDQKRENSLNKLPTRTNLRSTNDVYDDSIRNRDNSLNKLQKRGRSSSHTLQPINRSGSSSKGSSQHSRNISTVSLIDNKEARRSKYSKMKMRRSFKDL